MSFQIVVQKKYPVSSLVQDSLVPFGGGDLTEYNVTHSSGPESPIIIEAKKSYQGRYRSLTRRVEDLERDRERQRSILLESQIYTHLLNSTFNNHSSLASLLTLS